MSAGYTPPAEARTAASLLLLRDDEVGSAGERAASSSLSTLAAGGARLYVPAGAEFAFERVLEHVADDLVRHGVALARRLQIGPVKGLIGNGGVRTRRKAAHHCGRDVARPRPHRQAHPVGHGARRPATSATGIARPG